MKLLRLAIPAVAFAALTGCAVEEELVIHAGQVTSQTLAAATADPDIVLATAAAGVNSAPKTARPSAPAHLAVTGVRVGSHEDVDRVVVDFTGGGEPGWFADYVTTPRQEFLGQPLEVEGAAYLNVLIDGTTYPQDISFDRVNGTGSVVEVVNGGTAGGRSQILIGLRSEAPYSVSVVPNPTRLVIDIARTSRGAS